MPTPTTADAHRQQDQNSPDDDGSDDLPLPDDSDGSTPSQDDGGSGLLGGVSISHKRLLMLGIAAALAYAAWRVYNSDSSSRGELADEVEEAFEEPETNAERSPEEQPEDPDDPDIQHNPNNPLEADAEVMEYLRGEKGDGDDVLRGDEG
jgi:hypothetical protein